MLTKKIITSTSMATLLFLSSGCVPALQNDPRAHYLHPIEGIDVVQTTKLADITNYQQEHTFVSQIKSDVFLNNKNLSLRAKNLESNFIAILSIKEQFKFDEHYMYYFFKKESFKSKN